MKPYIQQLERARRYLKKMEACGTGEQSSIEGTSDSHFDDFYSFFIHCYHVKDWLKAHEDCPTKADKDGVESFVSINPPLAICADVCNGLKHLILDPKKNPRSGANPEFPQKHRRHYRVVGDGGSPKLRVEFDHGNQTYDAVDLGRQCIELWEGFIPFFVAK
jgi:hypothetical protein